MIFNYLTNKKTVIVLNSFITVVFVLFMFVTIMIMFSHLKVELTAITI